MTKALLVKAPSSLDVDLLKYDEVRIKVEYKAGQQYTYANLIESTDDLTATFVESDNMTFRNVGSKAVSLLQIDDTKPSSCIVSVRPFNTENITGICSSDVTPGAPKGIYTFYGSNLNVAKYLKNLKGIALTGTSVSGDISALSGLTKLARLYIGGTAITGDIKTLVDKIANKNIEHDLFINVFDFGRNIVTNITYDGKACTQKTYTFHFKTDGTYTVE